MPDTVKSLGQSLDRRNFCSRRKQQTRTTSRLLYTEIWPTEQRTYASSRTIHVAFVCLGQSNTKETNNLNPNSRADMAAEYTIRLLSTVSMELIHVFKKVKPNPYNY